MTTRSRLVVMLWEIWRVTRGEAARKLALPTGIGLVALALGVAFGPSDNPTAYRDVNDNIAAFTLSLIVAPHLVGWLSMLKLTGGRPGFPLYLTYTRPVRTAVLVGLPMAYLTALSSAIYLVSAMILRAASGYAFPLLPVAAWMAAITVVALAATWSTRNGLIMMAGITYAITKAFKVAMDRLTAVEIPDTFDWPPRLWPTLFDWPRTDYAWIAVIGLVCFGVAVAGVARQRRGAGWLEAPAAQRDGLWDRLGSAFRIPCPVSSATRAQLWFDLRSNGLPVLTTGVVFAIVIVLVSAVSGPIDAAWNADPNVPCQIGECFYVRAWPPLLVPIALFGILALGTNAFGIRRRQGRTYVSAFEATPAFSTAHLAVLKLFVKTVCVLAALIAIGVSAWISMPLLGDAVFIQMWGVPLNSRRSVVAHAFAGLNGYEQLALAIVAVVAVVIGVAAFAVLGALRLRYSRRTSIAALSLLLSCLALALLALAKRNGIVSPFVFDALFAAARGIFFGATVFTTVYVFRSGFAERVLTVRYAGGAVAIWAAFGAAWVTGLHIAGVQISGMSAMNAISVVSPTLLPLMASGLAPWSYSRIRHT
jgi:hypothetical protein